MTSRDTWPSSSWRQRWHLGLELLPQHFLKCTSCILEIKDNVELLVLAALLPPQILSRCHAAKKKKKKRYLALDRHATFSKFNQSHSLKLRLIRKRCTPMFVSTPWRVSLLQNSLLRLSSGRWQDETQCCQHKKLADIQTATTLFFISCAQNDTQGLSASTSWK